MRESGIVMHLMCMHKTTTQYGTAASTDNAQSNIDHKNKKQNIHILNLRSEC